MANISGNELVAETTSGPRRTKLLVNCGGLYSDRVARLCGVDPGVQIVPFARILASSRVSGPPLRRACCWTCACTAWVASRCSSASTTGA